MSGGLISALLARRWTFTLERGQTCSRLKRALLALCGGVIVGYASRMANGCTSGQALSGGALLLSGSLINARTIRIEPPLNITEEHILKAIEILDECMGIVYKKHWSK